MAPPELKYESIGSSPDMDKCGPMEVRTKWRFERPTEIANSKGRSAHHATRRLRDIIIHLTT
jgi:hypothetical protein